MSGLDKDSTSGNQDYLSQPRSSQIIWPLCFMFGFVSSIANWKLGQMYKYMHVGVRGEGAKFGGTVPQFLHL